MKKLIFAISFAVAVPLLAQTVNFNSAAINGGATKFYLGRTNLPDTIENVYDAHVRDVLAEHETDTARNLYGAIDRSNASYDVLEELANGGRDHGLTRATYFDGSEYTTVDYDIVGTLTTNIISTNNLVAIKIGTSVTNIGDRVFLNCHDLTDVTIPDSVTNIWEYAFSHCSGLTSVAIPARVTSIGTHAFIGCSGLASVTILGNVTSDWNGSPFTGCTNLTTLVLGGKMTKIGTDMFTSCSSLTSVSISDGVTSIGDFAFNYCNRLTSVTIPNNVTNIGKQAFCDCWNLTSVMIPDSVTSIGYNAFYNCSSLAVVYYTRRDNETSAEAETRLRTMVNQPAVQKYIDITDIRRDRLGDLDPATEIYAADQLAGMLDLASANADANLNIASNALNQRISGVVGNLNTASNALNSRIGTISENLNTASNALNSSIGTVSGNLNTASNALNQRISTVADNLNTASNALNTSIGTVSGNLNTASNALNTSIGAVSGNLNTASNALNTAISGHIADKNNPHEVTLWDTYNEDPDDAFNNLGILLAYGDGVQSFHGFDHEIDFEDAVFRLSNTNDVWDFDTTNRPTWKGSGLATIDEVISKWPFWYELNTTELSPFDLIPSVGLGLKYGPHGLNFRTEMILNAGDYPLRIISDSPEGGNGGIYLEAEDVITLAGHTKIFGTLECVDGSYSFSSTNRVTWNNEGLATIGEVNTASNALNGRISTVVNNLNTASNALNTSIGAVADNLNTASNALNISIGAVSGNLNTASNALNESIGTVLSTLSAHEGRKDNPHEVTAAQVGALALTGGTVTGDIILGTNSATPGLVFQRLKTNDGNIDYKIFANGAGLLIQSRNSSGSWTTQYQFLPGMAFAYGDTVAADANYSTAHGKNTSATAQFAYAHGENAIAGAKYAYAVGTNVTASGVSSIALGTMATASYNNSYVWNGDTSGHAARAQGSYNVYPAGGVTNFYIGDDNLKKIIQKTSHDTEYNYVNILGSDDISDSSTIDIINGNMDYFYPSALENRICELTIPPCDNKDSSALFTLYIEQRWLERENSGTDVFSISTNNIALSSYPADPPWMETGRDSTWEIEFKSPPGTTNWYYVRSIEYDYVDDTRQ